MVHLHIPYCSRKLLPDRFYYFIVVVHNIIENDYFDSHQFNECNYYINLEFSFLRVIKRTAENVYNVTNEIIIYGIHWLVKITVIVGISKHFKILFYKKLCTTYCLYITPCYLFIFFLNIILCWTRFFRNLKPGVLETHLVSVVSVFLISAYYYNFITSVVNDRYVLQTDSKTILCAIFWKTISIILFKH